MARLRKWQTGLNTVLKNLKNGTYGSLYDPNQLYDYYYGQMLADEEEMYLDEADKWWSKIDLLKKYLQV